jgi:hypothetical protein
VATRLGLLSKSFDLAAQAFGDAVGGSMSADSLRRVTEGWGQAVAELRAGEAQRANAVAQRGEGASTPRVAVSAPIGEQANVSSDGVMMLVRGEGWKEVKLLAISEVQVRPPEARGAGPSRREHDPLVELSQHSYQAGLWEADTFGLYQYAEALRRGLVSWAKSSSVNDAAVWIKRITSTNFPGMPQVVDWSHAAGHLWAVANAVYGEQTPAAKQWAERHLDLLWEGRVGQVVSSLDQLHLDRAGYAEGVREAPDYFRGNQERMRYAAFRAQGLPIGSGTVESAAVPPQSCITA